MKIIGKLITIGLIVAFIGMIFKFTLIPGGGILLVLSLSYLSVLTFIQLFLSFLYMNNNKPLKIVSAFMSLTLSINFIGILFRYQWWPNSWHILNFGGLLFIIMTIIFMSNFKEHYTSEYKRFVIKNLLIPWIFIFIFSGLHYILSYETFYNSFNSHKGRMTYQEFLSGKDTFELEKQSK